MEAKTNLGRVSIVPKGAYDPLASYQRLDLVRYGGEGYLVLRAVQGVTPEDGQDYMLVAVRGRDGVDGLPGRDGKDGLPGKDGEAGSSIASIERTDGTGAPGQVDTYTITLTDGSTTTFRVYNGADGDGAGDMTRSVYDPQGRAQDVFGYASQAVEDHDGDQAAHSKLFAALEARHGRHVIAVRERDPAKPDYGLAGGEAVVLLDAGPYTGGAEVTAIISGEEYDAKNMSASGDDVPDGTLILRKLEE